MTWPTVAAWAAPAGSSAKPLALLSGGSSNPADMGSQINRSGPPLGPSLRPACLSHSRSSRSSVRHEKYKQDPRRAQNALSAAWYSLLNPESAAQPD
jgi:hypothetical protein